MSLFDQSSKNNNSSSFIAISSSDLINLCKDTIQSIKLSRKEALKRYHQKRQSELDQAKVEMTKTWWGRFKYGKEPSEKSIEDYLYGDNGFLRSIISDWDDDEHFISFRHYEQEKIAKKLLAAAQAVDIVYVSVEDYYYIK